MHRKHLVLGVLAAVIGLLLLPAIGQAGTAPALAWSPTTSSPPATWDFGTVSASSNPSQTFTLTNLGTTATSVLKINLSGTNPSPFSITADTCSATSLGPKKQCTVTITYTETAQGASDTATLTATSNKPSAAASILAKGATSQPPLYYRESASVCATAGGTFTLVTAPPIPTGASNVRLWTCVTPAPDNTVFLTLMVDCSFDLTEVIDYSAQLIQDGQTPDTLSCYAEYGSPY